MEKLGKILCKPPKNAGMKDKRCSKSDCKTLDIG
jgi:hypothetical protein